MKILYGIQGTGNGHITRARVMAKALKKRGVDVDYLFSGRPANKYFDMQRFGDYRCFEGLTFHCDYGKVNYFKTVRKACIWQLLKDIASLDIKQYDLVLSDFEPVSAWAAKIRGVPVINISHQAVFTNDKVPAKGLGWLKRQILKYFAPADVLLGIHWFHFGQTIMPPFIEREHSKREPGEEILVYMPFEKLADITDFLNSQDKHIFIVYHPDIKENRDEVAIHYRRPCRKGFLRDLESCAGVIANAGFELSSEALCIGKKILLKPLAGQFEQVSNAETLNQLGLASVMYRFDNRVLEGWLLKAANKAINYPSDATPLVDWLMKGNYQNPHDLCRQLWRPISIPQFTHTAHGA